MFYKNDCCLMTVDTPFQNGTFDKEFWKEMLFFTNNLRRMPALPGFDNANPVRHPVRQIEI